MNGTLCHFEIFTKDPARAEKFYGDLFGWQFSHDMGNDYILFNPGKGAGGAISKVEEFTPSVGLYFEVDSIDGYLKKAGSLGAESITAKTEIPGHGWYAIFRDPDGNSIGLYEDAK